ncbi:MAG: peptidoglycan DD-metalloendopeptidase family protein [Myxococcota bacterium]
MSPEPRGWLPWALLWVGCGLLIGSAASGVQAAAAFGGPVVHKVSVPQVVPAPVPDPPPDQVRLTTMIRRGATFSAATDGYSVPSTAVRSAGLDLYDLAKVRPGRELTLQWVDGEAPPVELTYQVDEDRTLVIYREEEVWTGRIDEVEYTPSLGQRAFQIDRSLWQDGIEAGLRPLGLVRLAKLFEYELDFNTELQKGAKLAVFGELLEAYGRPAKLNTIHAVRLQNGSRVWTVLRHVDSAGRESFFHEDGRSLKKPFLRSPLEFSRVTSGFNPRRYHPVLKRRRPHNGTDFGAPAGTPVRSVAQGKVVRAGRAGGHGNFVKVRHDGGYETSYSHLSAINVKKGQKVRQGHIVGRVGSTGMSTGPHLHFQIWKDGSFIDAMKTKLPRQSPLPTSEKAAFEATRAEWLPQLDRAWQALGPIPE